MRGRMNSVTLAGQLLFISDMQYLVLVRVTPPAR